MAHTETRPATLPEAFQRTAAIAPDAVALREPGDTRTLTWGQYAGQVRRVAAGLAAIGVTAGDTVALMMANRIDFYPLEVGAQHLGATSFSVYNTLSTVQLAHVLGNAGPRVIICEPQYVDRIRASGACPERIVCVDEAPAGTLSVSELIAAGAADFDFDASWRAVRPDSVATLIYTSGTTGAPKGVETTHDNLLFQVYGIAGVLDFEFGDTITSFMPSAHIADRLTGLYVQEVLGTQITVVDDPKRIAAALTDLRPTVWGAVPRVWEKLEAAVHQRVAHEADPARRQSMERALSIAAERSDHLLAGRPVPHQLEADWAAADGAVLSTIRAELGLDRCRWAMSGAAPIPPRTLGFFAGIGIPIAEIWGMSELSCICTVSHPRDARLGTVGKLLPGMESRLADDGELLVRGPLVMKGYRNEPDKTAEAVDPDGWLHTGDVATVDRDGYFRIVDRKKEMIINSAGKNMSPTTIEHSIKAETPLIGAIAAIGDRRPYITALIALDADSAAAYGARHRLSDTSAEALSADPGVVTQIRAAVAAGNEQLARVEQIKRFRILDAFWEPGGDELTPTTKLKRTTIAGKYTDVIDDLYLDDPPDGVLEPATD